MGAPRWKKGSPAVDGHMTTEMRINKHFHRHLDCWNFTQLVAACTHMTPTAGLCAFGGYGDLIIASSWGLLFCFLSSPSAKANSIIDPSAHFQKRHQGQKVTQASGSAPCQASDPATPTMPSHTPRNPSRHLTTINNLPAWPLSALLWLLVILSHNP